MEHAVSRATEIAFVHSEQPFSSFDYVEGNFGGLSPIRRLFSQARSAGMRSFVSEKINAFGLIAEENDDIRRLYPNYRMDDLRRVTFWTSNIASGNDVERAAPEELLGYAIVKQDSIPGRDWCWHVFEAVMWPTKYPYSYIPGSKRFQVRCGERVLEVGGVLYCQQNKLNKACAQVALRSLCSLHKNPSEVSFRRIHELASQVSGAFDPSQGLEVRQMRAVLEGFGIGYTDIDYNTVDEADRETLAYQKFIYAGIESGAGALLGFQLAGPEAAGHHIIPFFGHTFNRDTWVPNADAAYFHVGEDTRYIPSESWVSTFIGHDDNFGSNYGVPRLYITPEQAQYVVSLYPAFVRYSGIEAEALAINMLYSVRKRFVPSDIPWHRRALDAIDNQKVVLRPLALTRDEYISHLRKSTGWQSEKEIESEELCAGLASSLPESLWLVELSVAELFPANLRKFGEVLLNAGVEPDPNDEARVFILARLPGTYILQAGTDSEGTPRFTLGPSSITSHTAVYTDIVVTSEA